MDSNDRRAAQGQVQIPGQVMSGDAVANPDMEGGEWRIQLFSDSRRKIVNMIMEYLKRHLPFSGQEGLQELEKIAIRCEEKSHTAATSHQDYLRKISLEVLEAKSQNPIANSLHPNAASNSRNPQDPASFGSSSQTGNANGGDWQVEVYQKIKSMNEMYFPELNEMYKRMAAKLQKVCLTAFQHEALNPSGPQLPKYEQLDKLRFLKIMLERFIIFLRTNKNEVQTYHKEKIVGVERQIISVLNSNRACGPLTQPPTHDTQQLQQQQSQIPQMHGNEGQMNSQMQQMVGIQHGTPRVQNNQQPVHMLQQSKQMQANMGSMLPNQAQQPQSQPMQQLMSQIQSQPEQMQQQLGLQQQSNTLSREMQQRIQTSAPLIQQQTTIDQQKKLLQSQGPMPDASLTSFGSSSQTGNANGGDWQVEVYQKIKSMNEMYFPELNEMNERMAAKLRKHEALNPSGPQLPKYEQLENLRFLKIMLERFIIFLRTNKNEVQTYHKEKIVGVEKQIISVLNSKRACGPLTQPPTHDTQQLQQQQSQIPQMHGNESRMNSQMQQMVGIQHGTPSVQTNQQPVHMLQQSKVGVHQQMQANMGSVLPNQAQQPQSQPMQQLMSQIQSQPEQMQQQLGLQQKSNTLPREMQQRIQTSAPLIQQQTTIDQQKQLLQSQGPMPEASLRNANGGDWREEIYQKIKSMNEMYFPELNEMYQRMVAKLQQHDALNPPGPQQPTNIQLDKLRFLKVMLERFILFLRTNKNEVQPHHKEKIVGVERQIINVLNARIPRGPLTLPPTHATQQPQQQQSQISQMHGNAGQMNYQMQPFLAGLLEQGPHSWVVSHPPKKLPKIKQECVMTDESG